MSARLLMVALDGADGARLDRWSADGTLPNLAALRRRGATVRLGAPAGLTDDALWASFHFSAPLGVHGRYFWWQRLAGGAMGMAHRDETSREPFWEGLSLQGRRVAVFDLPKCGAPRALAGLHLVDWLVHGTYFATPRSHPQALAATLCERYGPAPSLVCPGEEPLQDDAATRRLRQSLGATLGLKAAAGAEYLGAEDWDLFLIGFHEAHVAGHLLWHLTDPRHPSFDAGRTARLGDPYQQILQDLDRVVGDLVRTAGPEAAVAVFTPCDMEPNASLSHLLPELLERLPQDPAGALPAGGSWELLPYNENAAALRLHLPADPPPCCEAARRLRQAALRGIEAVLRELTDAATGRPVVQAIQRPSAEQRGPRAGDLPDLLIHPAPGILPAAVTSPRLGRIEAPPPALRTGNHAAGGLLIAAGVPIAGVTALEHLGPLAAQALRASGPPGREPAQTSG